MPHPRSSDDALVKDARRRYLMPMSMAVASRRDCDVAVVGAGTVGLTLAVGLAQAGLKVELIGTPGPSRPGRTVALLAGSVALLDRLGLWGRIASLAAPLASMRIVDATGSLFGTPPVQFDAREIDLPAFGYNVVNDVLERELMQAVAATPSIGIVQGFASAYHYGAEFAQIDVADGGPVYTRLVVAADGRSSLARKSARIGVRTRRWPQTALTALFRHAMPHHDTSVEFHTRQGPFTLVPLPDAEDGTFRSSLVWVMTPEQARKLNEPATFAQSVEQQAQRLYGSMTLRSAIGMFPIITSISARLTARRLVLTGEAAHGLPPIGAQGLNLSLRDVAALLGILSEANGEGHDIGAADTLARYAASRRGDVAMRSVGVDLLNSSLLSRSPLVEGARGVGLAALGSVGPLRRFVMRHGLLPPQDRAEPRAALSGRARGRVGLPDLTPRTGIGDQPPL